MSRIPKALTANDEMQKGTPPKWICTVRTDLLGL